MLGLGAAAAAAAAAALARGRRATSSPEITETEREEPESPGVTRPAQRPAAAAAASARGAQSVAVVEPPVRATPPRTDRSLVEVLSPRSRLGERVEDDDAETEEPALQVCEIMWWRGYVKTQFYVEADPPLDSLIASRFFRVRGSDVPERSHAATAVHEALVAELVSAGWRPDGRGAHWFSDRFQREDPKGAARDQNPFT